MKPYELRTETGTPIAVLHEDAMTKLMSGAEYEVTTKQIDGCEVLVFVFTRDMATVFPSLGWTVCIYAGSYLRRQ